MLYSKGIGTVFPILKSSVLRYLIWFCFGQAILQMEASLSMNVPINKIAFGEDMKKLWNHTLKHFVNECNSLSYIMI